MAPDQQDRDGYEWDEHYAILALCDRLALTREAAKRMLVDGYRAGVDASEAVATILDRAAVGQVAAA